MRLGRSRFGRQEERGAELRSGRARTKRESDVLPGRYSAGRDQR